MKKTFLLLTLCLTGFLLQAQIDRYYTMGGDHDETLIAGQSYKLHMNGNTRVGLRGGCKDLIVNMDGKSQIHLHGLNITGNLIVESINGASYIQEEDGYTSTYYSQAIIVQHFDNPDSYILIKSICFQLALLGDLGENCGTVEIGHNADGSPLFTFQLPCWINPLSVNGGGLLNINVKEEARGKILGKTRVILTGGHRPKTSRLSAPDGGTIRVE